MKEDTPVGNDTIEVIENKIIDVQQRKIDFIRRQRYEEASSLRTEENKLFSKLETLTSAEYLREKWKVKNAGEGHYRSLKS